MPEPPQQYGGVNIVSNFKKSKGRQQRSSDRQLAHPQLRSAGALSIQTEPVEATDSQQSKISVSAQFWENLLLTKFFQKIDSSLRFKRLNFS